MNSFYLVDFAPEKTPNPPKNTKILRCKSLQANDLLQHEKINALF